METRQDGASAAGQRGQLYTASKTRHAEKWRALRAAGYPVNSTWIDEAGPGESVDLTDLWVRCIREASEAACVLVYAEDGDVLKGAFVEVGCALALGKPVLAVGLPSSLSMLHHPLVEALPTLDEAVSRAKEICAGVREVVQESQPSTAPAGPGEPSNELFAVFILGKDSARYEKTATLRENAEWAAQAVKKGIEPGERIEIVRYVRAPAAQGEAPGPFLFATHTSLAKAKAQPPASSQGMREAVRLAYLEGFGNACKIYGEGRVPKGNIYARIEEGQWEISQARAALSRSQEAPNREASA